VNLYDHRWRKARKAYLARHPLCVMCKENGRTTPATVVDHIVPHKRDPGLFWDRENWQSLCKRHHDSWKQSYERTGRIKGCSVDGIPLEPSHPWREG